MFWIQEAEGLVRKLQQAALESGVPAAKSRAPLLAAMDLEHRKWLHGHAAGPSISRDVLSEVLRLALAVQKANLGAVKMCISHHFGTVWETANASFALGMEGRKAVELILGRDLHLPSKEKDMMVR